ncbi:MAG TPA: aminopeptidase [Candidatus Binatia bacterium]|nr:aminopeptidase [Candidatus Binatia bacterium]
MLRASRISLALAVLGLASLVGCGGCSPAYVARSAYEEARILWRREPIADVLARPDVDPDTRKKLETLVAARAFARDQLGLDVDGAYATYSNVSEGALLQVVSACERLRLRPYTWWFPIIGSVTYKGYFSEDDAKAEARRLEEAGYDTYVRPSLAFSTLGWFDDPVLSSWLVADRARLVELVIHELLHRTTYLAGETAFNESFANFVGNRGAIAFFTATEGEDAAETEEARATWAAELKSSDHLMRAIAELRALYAAVARERRPLGVALEQRDAIFAQLGDPKRINNAVILALAAYEDRLAWFEDAAARSDDLRSAIALVRTRSEADREHPWRALALLAGRPAPAEDGSASDPGKDAPGA